MKKYLLIVLVATICVSALAQDKKDKIPFMVKSLSAESYSSAEVQTSGGSISVTAVNASEARVEVYVYPNNSKDDLSKDEIQQRLTEKYDLELRVVNNKLVATAKSKEKITDWKKALNIAFKLYVPAAVVTDLATSGGSIHISGMSGKQDFATSGGSLHIKDVTGKIDGRTSGGSIHLENSTNEVELSTSGGSINASHCKGKLRLSTSGGSLHLEDLEGDIRATTSGGSIYGKNIGGELATHTSGGSIRLADLSCSVETSTSGGNVQVSIKRLGAYVKISNSAGRVELTLPKNAGVDLDLSGKIADTRFEKFDGKIDEHRVKGKLNGGGIPVTVDAGSGRIALDFN